MSQGSGIPPPNKRRKSDYDANPGNNEESADFAEGGFNYPTAATDADKYRSNFYSILGRQSFPKYVAQIASALDPEAAAAASDLPPEAPFMKSANSKRDQGQAAAATTQASQTALPNSSSNSNAPQAKTLTAMGSTNNKFFGVSKTSASATTGSSAISAIASASSSSNIADASSSNVIGNIGLLGTWFPPPQAKWFRIDTIHDIEKQALPEFFSGKNPTKTPQIYKEYRDFMITSYRQNIKPQNTITGSSGAYHPHHSAVPIMAAAAAGASSSAAAMGGAAGASATSIAAATAAAAANPAAGGISFTMCRRYLTGDVSAIYQVYRFLEHWGLIANHRTSFVADGAGSLPLDCPIPGADPTIIPSSTSSSLNVAAEIISSNNNNNVNNNGNNVDEQQQQQQQTNESRSSSSELPVKAEEMVKKEAGDDDNEDNAEAQNVDYGSHHCVFIEHTAGIPDVDDANGNRWIRYEDVIGNEKDIWTDQETFLLLEALKTYSSWSDVSRYVATKTPRQCLEHFLKLPINPSSTTTSSSTEPKSTDDNGNAVDTLAELIRSTPGCTDALSASDVCDDGLGTAARVGLGIARARAAELAKEEDAAIEELLAEAIDAQAQKVDIKLKYLSKYERLLQGEWKALSEIKNSLLSEKVVLVSSIIKNEEAAVAAAAAAAVGMDGTVGDMVGMGIDMGAVQQDQQEQQQEQNQQDQQQGQQQDQQQEQQQNQQDPSMVIGGIDADEMQSGASQFMNSPTLFSPGSF